MTNTFHYPLIIDEQMLDECEGQFEHIVQTPELKRGVKLAYTFNITVYNILINIVYDA